MAPKLHQSQAAVSSLIPPTSETKKQNTAFIWNFWEFLVGDWGFLEVNNQM